MFLAEINGLEVVRDNQKTFELSTSFTPSAIDVHGSLVAVGGEVGCLYKVLVRFLRLIVGPRRMQKSGCTTGTASC